MLHSQFGLNYKSIIYIFVKVFGIDWGAQQLTGDEGFYLPNGKLLCLGNAQTIETVHEGQ